MRREGGEAAGRLMVAAYGEKWLAERQERGVRSIADDRGRFTKRG
jgi:hypothetical protein